MSATSLWPTRRNLLAAASEVAGLLQMGFVAGDVHASQQSNNGGSAMGTT
jgi:hypothetical protein